MKTLQIVSTLILLIGLISPLQAQDCKFFFPSEEGTELEITFYNKRGKVQSVQTQKIINKKQTGDATVLDVRQTMNTDNKGEDEISTNYEVRCEDGKFYMDMKSFISNMDMGQMQQSGDVEMEITADSWVFPSDMEVGMTLPPTTMEMKMGASGFNMMTTTVTMKNWKVEARETITTPAGTFDAFKITYDTETKSMMKVESENTLWLAEDVGVVRAENYNKRGKLQGYQELTDISR